MGEPRYTHTTYSLGFQVDPSLELPPPKPSMRPGRRWFARLACRWKGHLDGIDGQCPRCKTVLNTAVFFERQFAKASREAHDEMVRSLYFDAK